jgi:hypothetical protein
MTISATSGIWAKHLDLRLPMTRKPEAKPQDDPEQSKRFIETARERGADETEEGARRVFKKVVTPPKPRKEKADISRSNS